MVKSKIKHKRMQIEGQWILVCGDNLEMTRADSKFNVCPFCGIDL